MKKIFLLIAVIGNLFLTSCEEKNIEVFGTERFVYFDKFWKDASYPGTAKADSTEVTFFFLGENETSISTDLIVIMSGRKLEKDMNFKLRVVDDMTTALPEEYTLQENYVFRAVATQGALSQFQDTIQIQLNKSTRLDNLKDGYRLVLELVPEQDLSVGQYERSRSIIHIKKDPVRPEWWTDEVDIYLLGTYTATKYKLFLENVPGARDLDQKMIEERPDEARKLALEFKKWLIANPSEDEFGPITVPV